MKMKHINLLFIAFVSLFWVGCSNFLDTRIDTDLTPEIVEHNRHTLFNLGNAIYAPMASGYWALDGNFFAAASDEAQRTQESGSTYVLNAGILTSDNVERVTDSYKKCYEGIRAANYFIDFAERRGMELLKESRDTIRDKVQYEKDKRNLKWFVAEAGVAKAYYYSELLKRFGGVPIIEEYVTGTNKPEYAKHNSYSEVVEYVVKLIEDNLEALQADWTTHSDNVATSYGRFDRKSALAIKSRLLLYAASPLNNPEGDMAKWERAAEASHDLISEMGYKMPENRDYRNYFVANGAVASKESIFLIRHGASNGPEKANYPISTPGGNSGVTPTHNLVSAYEYIDTPIESQPYANRDPRLAATVVTNGSTWNGRIIDQTPGGIDDMSKLNTSKTGYYLKKFLKDDLNLVQDATVEHVWVVYRYGEILLNFAEAMNNLYGPDAIPEGFSMSARDALMEVRDAASTSLPAVDATDAVEFDKAVKHERRIELAFEDHRYWDLLRWEEAESVLNQPIKGIEVTVEGAGLNYTEKSVATRVFHSHNYHLPFSRTEISNSNGTMTQNKGY